MDKIVIVLVELNNELVPVFKDSDESVDFRKLVKDGDQVYLDTEPATVVNPAYSEGALNKDDFKFFIKVGAKNKRFSFRDYVRFNKKTKLVIYGKDSK